MDLEILVRLAQMQMYTNSFDSRKSEAGGFGSANFALILAALMESKGANTGLGQTGRAANTIADKPAIPLKTVSVRHLRSAPVAGPEKAASRTGLDSIMERAAQKFGIDPDLLKAVARVESGFNPLAVSESGAMGLMQLMPGTAASLGVKDPFNSAENVEGGARYLRSLLDKYGGNKRLALAAYNAGPGAVDRHGGVPPYSETVSYLNKINNIFRIF
jgi:soluble lytic murein transglycosylase-like protein